jgi:hypothetical protein
VEQQQAWQQQGCPQVLQLLVLLPLVQLPQELVLV